jgi:hypothetical protein
LSHTMHLFNYPINIILIPYANKGYPKYQARRSCQREQKHGIDPCSCSLP